jgi:hypothetical protein
MKSIGVDTIRALFTYSIALIVITAGGWMIYVSRNDPNATDTVAIVAGFMGATLTFVFNQETQTRTARQSNTATAQGAASVSTSNGHAKEEPHAPN